MSGSQTKARILAGALELFNAEGYASQSAVDVASALGISPGHLYYHFKGKAELAAALLDAHLEELEAIASAGLRELDGDAAGLEALWTQVHILIEEVHDARFAWREARFLAASDPALAQRIRQGGRVLERFARAALGRLLARGAIRAGPEVLDGLVAQTALGLALQSSWQEVAAGPDPGLLTARQLVARSASLVMLPIVGLAAAT
jgi:AcrR family transcriptional regulator